MAQSKIATAYVQVMPSMEGVATKVKSFFGSAGDSAGRTFGGKIGGAVTTAIKTGVAAGAAGLGLILKESLGEGADLQQSLGGIETLFKDSAGSVIEAAEQAYRTAGMSANSYMETVTGFSAGLISSLEGDTQAAASVADMAITDMSDNANKMGTDMELIQNAYQGFAKQNYTMLDNLKLGYGGTKTEMERLLADAQALTGIEYDIDNLADVYSAIHAIQGEMEISGRTAEEAAEIYERTGRVVGEQLGATAKEASTTLTGSFNAMKASAQNVLGNLALGRPMEESLQALAKSTKTFLGGNLIPMVKNVFTSLPGSITKLVKELIPGSAEDITGSISSNFVTFMEEKAPDLLASGGEALRSWAQGLKDFLPELGGAAGDMIVALGEFLTDPETLKEIGATVVDVGTAIISGVWDGIVAAYEKMKEAWPGLFESLGNGFAGAQAGLNYNATGTFTPTIPGYETGLDYVPRDNFVARLHEGEMVLTRAQANAYRNGQAGGGVTVIQHIHSQAQTAADLMQEARHEQEKAVIFGV